MRPFRRKNHVHKIPRFRGGDLFFFLGGGGCRFYFYGRAIFLNFNRTLGAQKLPQSTVKRVLPSNESYESKTGCNRTLATVLWVPLNKHIASQTSMVRFGELLYFCVCVIFLCFGGEGGGGKGFPISSSKGLKDSTVKKSFDGALLVFPDTKYGGKVP